MRAAASGRRVALSVASTLTLAGMFGGVPALLIALHGRPDQPATTFAGLGDLLGGGRLDPGTVIDLIALAAWIAWLVIAAAITVEVVAWTRGRPTPNLPIGRTVQPLVRNLVATATLLIGTFGAPVRGAAATMPAGVMTVAPVPRPTAAIRPPAAVDTPTPASSPTCVVVRHDTLWDLAETHLHNPLRWREIFELNRDRKSVV